MSELDLTLLKDLRKPSPRSKGPRSQNLIGRTFGQLTPLGLLGATRASGDALWLLQCSCCRQCLIVRACELKRGSVTSHQRREAHGQTNSRLWCLWRDVNTRGRNPNYKQAKDYSLRGITVCRGFRSFTTFLKVMGQPPSRSHQIDRVDNDGGYWCGQCPECTSLGRASNMRWATQKEQARNKRNNRSITAFNHAFCMAEWAERTGLSVWKISDRLAKGQSPEEVFKCQRANLLQIKD